MQSVEGMTSGVMQRVGRGAPAVARAASQTEPCVMSETYRIELDPGRIVEVRGELGAYVVVFGGHHVGTIDLIDGQALCSSMLDVFSMEEIKQISAHVLAQHKAVRK